MAKRVNAAGTAPAPTLPLFLTANDVCRALKLGRRTLDDLVARGVVPVPVRFTRKTVRWPRGAIEALGTGSAA